MWFAMSSRCAAALALAAMALLSTAGGAPAAPLEAPADSSGVQPQRGYFDAPTWVMARSGLVPGWGQAKNGQWLKAVVVAGIEAAMFERLRFERGRIHHYRERAAVLPAEEKEKHDYYMSKVERHKNHRRDYIWWTGLAILLSMGDAYVDAQLRDFDVNLQYEPEPQPGEPTESGDTSALAGSGGTIRLAIGRRF